MPGDLSRRGLRLYAPRMHAIRRFALAAALVLPMAGVPSAAAADSSTAAGLVFFPNPVQQLGDESLTDSKDADLAALQPAYRDVTLTDLDGSGTLTGRYVAVKSNTGQAAQETAGA